MSVWDFFKQGYADSSAPLMIGLSALIINNLAAPNGIKLVFNIVLLLGSAILLGRVIKSNLSNWRVVSLALLGIGMPFFAVANMVQVLSPEIESGLIRFGGYIFVTTVIAFNFLSLIVSANLEKKVFLTKKEEVKHEQKILSGNNSINSSTVSQ